MKHQHHDMIVAWAEGSTIQVRLKAPHPNTNKWITLDPTYGPTWSYDMAEYRIKPEPKKYRVWESKGGIPYALSSDRYAIAENELEKRDFFVRWLSGWVQYE